MKNSPGTGANPKYIVHLLHLCVAMYNIVGFLVFSELRSFLVDISLPG